MSSSLSPQVHSSCQNPASWWASHGVTSSFRHIRLLQCGVFHVLQWHSLPHHGLRHGLKGSLCSGTWSTSSPSFFPDLGVCRVVSLMFSLLCLAADAQVFGYFSFLTMLSQRHYHHHWWARPILEPAGTGFVRHRGSFWQLLTVATPAAPPPPKPCHANPVQLPSHLLSLTCKSALVSSPGYCIFQFHFTILGFFQHSSGSSKIFLFYWNLHGFLFTKPQNLFSFILLELSVVLVP